MIPSVRYNGRINDADRLVQLLTQHSNSPVEAVGATALFEAISGGPLRADVLNRTMRSLTAREHHLLDAAEAYTGHERRCLLRGSTGVLVAETTALLLAHRVPEPARAALGMASTGEPLTVPTPEPLGRALRGLGVIREPLQAKPTPCRFDDAGEEQVVYSAARLWLEAPIALVTERVYRRFLEAFPWPWPNV